MEDNHYKDQIKCAELGYYALELPWYSIFKKAKILQEIHRVVEKHKDCCEWVKDCK